MLTDAEKKVLDDFRKFLESMQTNQKQHLLNVASIKDELKLMNKLLADGVGQLTGILANFEQFHIDMKQGQLAITIIR